MLAVSTGFLFGTASSASAQDPYDPNWPAGSGWPYGGGVAAQVFTEAGMDCQISMTEVDYQAEPGLWRKFLDRVNPWYEWDPSEATTEIFAGLRCAWNPAFVPQLIDWAGGNSEPVTAIGISFKGSEWVAYMPCTSGGGGVTPAYFDQDYETACAILDGHSPSTVNRERTNTDGFKQVCGIYLRFGTGTYIYSFPTAAAGAAHGGGTSPYSYVGSRLTTSGKGGPCLGSITPDTVYHVDNEDVATGGWYGDGSSWSQAGFCAQLQIYSDTNLNDEYLEPGGDVTLRVAKMPNAGSAAPAKVRVSFLTESTRVGDTIGLYPTVPATFTFSYGDRTDPKDWWFVLECDDGSHRYVFFDPSGQGGAPDFSGSGFRFSECMADMPEDTEATGFGDIVGSAVKQFGHLMRCIGQWAVSPEKPMGYHWAKLDAISRDSVIGDIRDAVTEPVGEIRNAVDNRSGRTEIAVGSRGSITLPALGDKGSKITAGLSVLILLGLLMWSIRTIARSAGYKDGGDEG